MQGASFIQSENGAQLASEQKVQNENEIQINEYGDIQKEEKEPSQAQNQVLPEELIKAQEVIEAIQVPDEPSSIIIDTKITTGVPILSLE